MMNSSMGGVMSIGGSPSQQQMSSNLGGVMNDGGAQSHSQPLSQPLVLGRGRSRPRSRPRPHQRANCNRGGVMSGDGSQSQTMVDCNLIGAMSGGGSQSQSQQPMNCNLGGVMWAAGSQPLSQPLVNHSSGGVLGRGGSQLQSQQWVNESLMELIGGGGPQWQLQQQVNHSPVGAMNCGPHSQLQQVAQVDFAEEQYVRAKTSVWWDIENCPAPKTVHPHTIAQNISSALMKLNYVGPLSISAYGDTARISPVVQQGLNSTGISLNHVPADAKDASDKKILVGMLLWAVDNPAPANYLLISGDRDFSDALHQLRMRRYNILLAQPKHASASLVAAAKSVWLWTSLSAGGPPITSDESSQIVNNAYGVASSSQSLTIRSIQTPQPLGTFRYRSVPPENQNFSTVPSSRHPMCTRQKKTLAQKNALLPSHKIRKKLTAAQKDQLPKCNQCQRPHLGRCPHDVQCYNCGGKGHVMKICTTPKNSTAPGYVFAMIQGGDVGHHANITATAEKAQPPKCNQCQTPHFDACPHENVQCHNCHEKGHISRNCRKPMQNTATGHVFAMIQGNDEADHANIAGDLDSSLRPEVSNSDSKRLEYVV